MAISFPLSIPDVNDIARVSYAPRSVVGVNQSPFTLSTEIQVYSGQRWEWAVELVAMLEVDFEPWLTFLLSLNGREGTFLFGDPARAVARGAATGTPLVKGAAQTGQDLITDGWSLSVTGILKAGDMIQLGSGSGARLHKVLVDANSDGSGNATLTLWPAIRTAPSDNAALVVSSPVGLFRLATNQPGWDIAPGVIANGVTLPILSVV